MLFGGIVLCKIAHIVLHSVKFADQSRCEEFARYNANKQLAYYKQYVN